MAWFDGFESDDVTIDGVRLHLRSGGRRDAPALVLLHGFPQTHVLWHRVALALADAFFVVLPDLRGYGDSDTPPGGPDHAGYSKRAMAADIVGLMRALGRERFGIAGHDRGGRVAHRLALDHPRAVSRLALIDIAPTLDMYERTDMAYASAYYHWFHLIQPHPLPERMIGGDPVFYLRWKLGGWGAAGIEHIEPQALAEYERCFTPATIHAMCEDYRAAAGIDLAHDRASRAAGEKIGCDTLVLWGERGVVDRLFDPAALWQAQCAATVHPQRVANAGHFIPEEQPDATAGALRAFFAA